jgi:DNA-binding protein HU-beta
MPLISGGVPLSCLAFASEKQNLTRIPVGGPADSGVQGRNFGMTKNDLIVQVSETSNLTRIQATAAVEATFDLITKALKAGDEVKIIGFGTFTVANRAAREGRNPRTGEPVQIAASKAPKFSAGKGLKDAVNR